MENKANKFWMYLIQKNKKIFTKEEVRENYVKFQEMWKDKKKDSEKDFKKVFDSLRKTRLRYMFNKKWYLLNKDEFVDSKNNRFEEYELIFRFLDDQKIPYYIGLSNAKYLNKLTWQNLKVIYIINTEFKLKRKIRNIEINLIKFPKDLIVNMALIKTNKDIPYSDIEKTLLDEIYYNKYKKGKLQIRDYDFEGINIEKIKAYLSFYSKYKIVKKDLMNKLNKEQIRLL